MTNPAPTPRRKTNNHPALDMRLAIVEQDLRSHSSVLTAHNQELADVKTERAVNAQRAIHLDDRFDRLESAIERIYRLGWWVLAAFGSCFIALFANFVFRGGMMP